MVVLVHVTRRLSRDARQFLQSYLLTFPSVVHLPSTRLRIQTRIYAYVRRIRRVVPMESTILGAFHLMTISRHKHRSIFLDHSINNKNRTILVSTCVTKCKAPIKKSLGASRSTTAHRALIEQSKMIGSYL